MSITVFTLATVCLNTFVTGLELSGEEANWGGATQAAGNNIPVISGLVKLARDKRAQCCNVQLKALENSLEKFMTSENYPDPDAVMADLEQFAPMIVKATQVKPSDLGDWNGEVTDSIAQTATHIAMAKYPDACVELIADSKETRPKFLDKNDPRYKATTLIIGKLNAVFFAPISVHDAALRQELQAIGIDLKELRVENRDGHAKTQEQTEEILAILKSQMGNGEVSEEALNTIRKALPKVVEHLEKSNTPEADDAEQALKKGDTKKAARLLIEKSDEKAAAAKDAQEFAVSKNLEAAEEARLAGALFFLNDTHEALEAYRKSTELDPENADGWNQLGHLQRRVGELDEASACYNNVLELGKQVHDQELIAVAYGNLGIVYQTRGDLDEAEAMYRKALELNKELGHKEGMASDYGNLGIVYQTRGDLDEAEAMYRKSLELNEQLGHKEGMANQYGNLGVVYKTRGDLEEAEAMYRKSLEFDEKLGNKEGMASDYGNLGNVYLVRGDLGEAEVMYRKSLEIEEQLGLKEGMAIDYGNLGVVYKTRGDLDEAEAMYRKALELNEQLGRKEGMAKNYCNLGIVYQTRGDLDEAEAMYRKALEIEEQLGLKEGMAIDYGNLGVVYQTRGDLDEAEAMHRKALELNEQLGRKEGMANQYNNLGNVYGIRGDLDEAEAMYLKSLEIDEELGRKEGMANQYGNLGNLYQTRGDLNEAARCWKLTLTLAREMGAKGLVSQVEDCFTDAGLDIPTE